MTDPTTAWTLGLAERVPEFAEIIVQLAQSSAVSASVDQTMDVPIGADLVECGNDLEGLLRGLILDLRAPVRKVTAVVSIGRHEPLMLSDGSRIAGFLDVRFGCEVTEPDDV